MSDIRRPGPEVRRTSHESGAGSGGIACPQCGARIAITLDDLLVRNAFTCTSPGCRTVLRLDRRGSDEAIGTLRQLKGRLAEIGR